MSNEYYVTNTVILSGVNALVCQMSNKTVHVYLFRKKKWIFEMSLKVHRIRNYVAMKVFTPFALINI